MFYQNTIKRLKDSVAYEQGLKDKFIDLYYERSEKITKAEAKIEEYAGDLLRKDDEIRDLNCELERFHDINVSLADQHRDAQQRLELLQDVLKQLQIPVKLPARKR